MVRHILYIQHLRFGTLPTNTFTSHSLESFMVCAGFRSLLFCKWKANGLRSCFGYGSLSRWCSGTNWVKTQLWTFTSQMSQTSTVETRSSIHQGVQSPHLVQVTLFNLRSHVLCSVTAALSEAVGFPMPPPPLCADGTGVYLYLEGLFSSVALVNGILTGQVHMPLCQTGSSSFNSWIFAGVGVHVL